MKKVIKWIPLVISPVLAIVSFILTYFLDPLKYSSQSSLAAIPAFLLSILGSAPNFAVILGGQDD